MVNDLNYGENLQPTDNPGCNCQSLSKSIKTCVLDLCGWEDANPIQCQSTGLINQHTCECLSWAMCCVGSSSITVGLHKSTPDRSPHWIINQHIFLSFLGGVSQTLWWPRCPRALGRRCSWIYIQESHVSALFMTAKLSGILIVKSPFSFRF